MFYLVLSGLILYAAMMFTFLMGWRKALGGGQRIENTREEDFITILVPVRNEEANIGLLLYDLMTQQDDHFEIIVVNDHSEDNTVSVVKNIQASNTKRMLRLISLTNSTGKKRAIELGVEHAKGSIIVTTDGDCRINPRWLRSIRACFNENSVVMSFGGVRMDQDGSLWSSLQAMEFSSLIGSGASTIALRLPTMCNGANLAFRKHAFLDVGGYEGNRHVPSGDDEFLLRKLSNRFPGRIRFSPYRDGVVCTRSQKTFEQFMDQRKRWAGKWRSHTSTDSAVLAVLIFIFHFFLTLSMLWVLKSGNLFLLAGYLMLRSLPELIFLRNVMQFLNMRWRWSAFIVLQVIYSPYVVAFGLLAQGRTYYWKGRTVSSAGHIINAEYVDNG